MIIVIEGLDNSGKSTLAKTLATQLNYPVVASEGLEKHPGEINERTRRYLDTYRTDVIFDRHPAISQNIYNQARNGGTPVKAGLIKELYAARPYIIYCRRMEPTLDGHVAKAHDSGAHLDNIKANYGKLQTLYDFWAITHANYIYRVGQGEPLPQLQDFVSDMASFHRKFGLEYTGSPRLLPDDMAEFRIGFMHEELHEYITAHDKSLSAKALDALVDLAYVTLGTAYLHGYDFREAWRRVHEANMQKVRVDSSTLEGSVRQSKYDVVKPAGWQPPDLSDLAHAALSQGT